MFSVFIFVAVVIALSSSAVRLQDKRRNKARGKQPAQPQSRQKHGTARLTLRGNSSAGNSSHNDAMNNSTSNRAVIRKSNRTRVARGYYSDDEETTRSNIEEERARKARFLRSVNNSIDNLRTEDLIADWERLPDDMEEELEKQLAAMQTDKASQEEIEGLLQDDNVHDFMELENQELTEKAEKEEIKRLLENYKYDLRVDDETLRVLSQLLKEDSLRWDFDMEEVLEMYEDVMTIQLKDVDHLARAAAPLPVIAQPMFK